MLSGKALKKDHQDPWLCYHPQHHYLEFVLSQLVCKSVTRRHQRRGLCLSAQQLVGEEIQSWLVPADWMLLINAMLLLNHTDFLYSLAQRKLVGISLKISIPKK